MDERFSSITKELSKVLDEPRFIHTLGVAYTAAALAMRYSYDINKAFLAGLLHDCAKAYSSDSYIERAKENGIEINEVEINHPGLLHAKLGAFYAKSIYGVDDTDILDSIVCHTTGKPEMSLLEKILYISDYIEPNRTKQERLAEIRKESFDDIDKGLLMILEDSYKYISRYDKSSIDPMTKATLDFYINNR